MLKSYIILLRSAATYLNYLWLQVKESNADVIYNSCGIPYYSALKTKLMFIRLAIWVLNVIKITGYRSAFIDLSSTGLKHGAPS